jgi:hypothetical protein
MRSKSIFAYALLGLFLYLILTSCSKNDNPYTPPDPGPDPIDTTKTDTTKNDTTHIDTTNNTTLSYPATYIFKITVMPETEYYQFLSNGNQKVSEPYYMRYSKNLLTSSIKDDPGLPYKEIRIVTKDKLTIVYKDNKVVENNEYTVQNNNDLYLKSSGYLGTFTPDKKNFNLNLGNYTYSNEANRPMYPRLYLSLCNSPDKNKTINYLAASQSLVAGDTLAINFTQMVYEKK